MQFQIYRSPVNALTGAASTTVLGHGQWRWRLVADNGEPIASGEGFHNEQDCRHSIALVMSTTTNTPVVRTTA